MQSLRATERKRRAREGNVAILTALTLTLMIMFVALSFDVGDMHRVKSEVQVAMDSAALAGASRLDGSVTGMTAAKLLADQYAHAHRAYTSAIPLTKSTIEVGRWDFTVTPGVFTKWGGSTDNGVLAQQNAVSIKYDVPSVATPFAALMGKASAPVGAAAVAVGCGSKVAACNFPIVIADCALKPPDATGKCAGYTFINAPDTIDNGGWTDFSTSGLGKPDVFNAIVAACTTNSVAKGGGASCDATLPPKKKGTGCIPNVDATTNECIGQGPAACETAEAGDGSKVKVENGNTAAGAGNPDVCGLVKNILERGVAAVPPKYTYFEVTMPVLKTGLSDVACTPSPPATVFTGTEEIAGFTSFDIYGVQCNGDPAPLYDNDPKKNFPVPPACAAASKVCIYGVERCDKAPVSSLGGGGCFGVGARRRLVQ
jgi:Flp pilus assembly protein TadG